VSDRDQGLLSFLVLIISALVLFAAFGFRRWREQRDVAVLQQVLKEERVRRALAYESQG
jgi:hypothetical protein